MMKLRGMFRIAAVTSLVAGAAPVLADILVNPGFETGDLPPWLQIRDFGGPEDWNVTAAEAHSGTYSATGVGNKLVGQFFDPIPTEDITEISLWLKQPEAVLASTQYFYSDNTDEQGGLLDLLGTDWEFFDVTSELAPNKDLIGFAVWGYIGGGPAEDRTYLDDVTIIPEPATLVLFSLGGLVFVRRRR